MTYFANVQVLGITRTIVPLQHMSQAVFTIVYISWLSTCPVNVCKWFTTFLPHPLPFFKKIISPHPIFDWVSCHCYSPQEIIFLFRFHFHQVCSSATTIISSICPSLLCLTEEIAGFELHIAVWKFIRTLKTAIFC